MLLKDDQRLFVHKLGSRSYTQATKGRSGMGGGRLEMAVLRGQSGGDSSLPDTARVLSELWAGREGSGGLLDCGLEGPFI